MSGNEEDKCIMAETIRKMQADIDKGENATKDIARIVGEIKEGNIGLKYMVERIQDTQASQSEADKEYKITLAASTQKMESMIKTNFDGMKNEKIEEKRIADIKKEAKVIEDKRLKEKKEDEDKRDKLIKEADDKEAKKWKRRLLIGLWISIFLMVLNYGTGMFVKYWSK